MIFFISEIKQLKLTVVKYIELRYVWRQVHRDKSILKLHHENSNQYTNSIVIINTLKLRHIKTSLIIIVAGQFFFFLPLAIKSDFPK